MAYAYPLISKAEALRELKLTTSPEPDDALIQDVIDQASAEIVGYLGWEISPEGAWIEYHQAPREGQDELKLRNFEGANFSVTEIAEDFTRAYGATSVLTVSTDYIVDANTGVITRVSGGSPTTWLGGFEAVRIKVTAGYDVADVPPEVKRICRVYMARLYHQTAQEDHGYQITNDATGTVTRYGPPKLMDWMASIIVGHKVNYTTCTRYETA